MYILLCFVPQLKWPTPLNPPQKSGFLKWVFLPLDSTYFYLLSFFSQYGCQRFVLDDDCSWLLLPIPASECSEPDMPPKWSERLGGFHERFEVSNWRVGHHQFFFWLLFLARHQLQLSKLPRFEHFFRQLQKSSLVESFQGKNTWQTFWIIRQIGSAQNTQSFPQFAPRLASSITVQFAKLRGLRLEL